MWYTLHPWCVPATLISITRHLLCVSRRGYVRLWILSPSEQNFSDQMLTPGTVKSLPQADGVIEWDCGCTASLPFTIWFLLQYGIYITITWINEKICKLTEMSAFACLPHNGAAIWESAWLTFQAQIKASSNLLCDISQRTGLHYHRLNHFAGFSFSGFFVFLPFFPPSFSAMDTKQTYLGISRESWY